MSSDKVREILNEIRAEGIVDIDDLNAFFEKRNLPLHSDEDLELIAVLDSQI